MSCFITFEGGEGSGKSTQLQQAATWLNRQGIPVLATREPGGSERCQEIRHLILQRPAGEQLVPLSELFLYMADRTQHVAAVIRPALAQGQFVLCDRYTDSTLTYQGCGRKLATELIQELNQIATQGLQPHLTFWLDLDPAQGLARIHQRQELDRLEAESLAFHQRIREGYQALAALQPERFCRIDASLGVEEVGELIRQRLERLLCELRR